MKYLITGGLGFIGKNMVFDLISKRDEVVIIDNQRRGKSFKNPDIIEHNLDIRDPSVIEIVKNFEGDIIIHLAAEHYIPHCENDPYDCFSTNVNGTLNILEGYRLNRTVSKFFLASSADVYAPVNTPLFEADDTSPIFVYGDSKLSCEALAKRFYKSHFLSLEKKLTIGRIFNAVGEHETTDHLVPVLIQRMASCQDGVIEIGNLFPRRDFVNVQSLAQKIVEVTKSTQSIITVNLGSGVTIPLSQLVQMLSISMKQNYELRVNPNYVRDLERECLMPDCSMLTALTGSACKPIDQEFINDLVKSDNLLQRR